MGSFSWLRADRTTKILNIAEGTKFKFLIPKEFGGGFIIDTYDDYGRLTSDAGLHDMYEILAFWNYRQLDRRHILQIDTKSNTNLPLEDASSDHNRGIGIDIGCYDTQMARLKYPLKLVSPKYQGTYEDLNAYSLSDPNQGWGISRMVDKRDYYNDYSIGDEVFKVEYDYDRETDKMTKKMIQYIVTEKINKKTITDIESVLNPNYSAQYNHIVIVSDTGDTKTLPEIQFNRYFDMKEYI